MNALTQQGFVALISAIIISALLLTITITMGMTGIFSRFNVLDSESKERSSALAEACADEAIMKLASDKDYKLVSPDDHNIAVGSDTCDIVSLSPATPRSFPITIQTRGVINKSYTNLVVTINSDYGIDSWEEVSNF